MSAPAAKTFGPPYTTTARTSSSADTAVAAARSSSWICAFSAFIGGRSSRIVAIPSSTDTVTTSPISCILLWNLADRVPERNQQPAEDQPEDVQDETHGSIMRVGQPVQVVDLRAVRQRAGRAQPAGGGRTGGAGPAHRVHQRPALAPANRE